MNIGAGVGAAALGVPAAANTYDKNRRQGRGVVSSGVRAAGSGALHGGVGFLAGGAAGAAFDGLKKRNVAKKALKSVFEANKKK